MDIYYWVDELITYGLKKRLIEEEDSVYVRNSLLDKLGLNYYPGGGKPKEGKSHAHVEILEAINEYAFKMGIIDSNKSPHSDIFDSYIMDTFVPMPSVVNRKFNQLYKESPKIATDYFYELSRNSNYIRTDRTNRNVLWKVDTKYGEIDITINLSKPEKDPKTIALARNHKSTGYPKCFLCYENVGFSGNISHPARQNHRIIPIVLNNEPWYMQYSPYVYYNEHSIIFNKVHTPMVIGEDTYKRMLAFIDVFPHYFIGSNADLPIVGGSLLSHDHYQGGRYSFPMEKAKEGSTFVFDGYEDITALRVRWPLSTIRLRGNTREKLISLATLITTSWRKYSDDSLGIKHETEGEGHNTITPIARLRDGCYELDLVLRNNRVNDRHPDGIFHPHVEIHSVKKENIGLIEVMGLAVLPSRLMEEIQLIREALLSGMMVEDVKANPVIGKFADIYDVIKSKYEELGNCSESDLENLIKNEIGNVFVAGLEHSGVFKLDEAGELGLRRFTKFVNDNNGM